MRLPSVFAPGPRLRIFAALTVASAAVISFVSIKHLAEYAGFGEFSWLFPLTLDAVAAFGMDLWVTHSPAWKRARALALTAILGSLVANIADHWIATGTILPAVLGAVPPGMLAALLAVLHQHASGTAAKRSGPDPAVLASVRDATWRSLAQAPAGPVRGPAYYVVPARVVRQAVPPPVQLRTVPSLSPVRKASPVRSGPVQRSDGPADDVIAKAIRDVFHASGRWQTKRDVMAAHGVGSGRALKLISLAKDAQEEKVATDG